MTHISNGEVHATGGAAYCDDALPFEDSDFEDRQDFIIDGDEVFLCGSRSRSSGSLAFPRRTVCQDTGARDMEPITFGPLGTLYSFSTVHVSSSRDVPYTIGYVDFENGLRVLAELRTQAPEALTCDKPVKLVTEGTRWYVTPLTSSPGAAQ